MVSLVSAASSVEIPGPHLLRSVDKNHGPPSIKKIAGEQSKNEENNAASRKSVTASTPASLEPAAPEKKERKPNDAVFTNGSFSFVGANPSVEKKKREPKKVVFTNGSFSFVSVDSIADEKASSNPASEKVSDRSKLDFARDKKRILEICYQTPGSSEIEVSLDKKSSFQKNGKKKKDKTKKKTNASQPEETQTLSEQNSVVDTKDTNQAEMKETTKGDTLPIHVTVDLENKSDGNLQNVGEAGSTTSKPRKKKKKKKKDKEIIIQRDAAGRVIRKRRKNRSKGRVVHPDCFKRGKDVKIGLATIDEGFYEGLDNSDTDSDFDSRDTFDSSDDDEFWESDDLPSPPESGDEDSDSISDDEIEEVEGQEVSDSSPDMTKPENTEVENSKRQRSENRTNIFRRLFTKEAKKAASANEVAPSDEMQPRSLPAAPSGDSNNDSTTLSNEIVQTISEQGSSNEITRTTSEPVSSNEMVRTTSEPSSPTTSIGTHDLESPTPESLDSTCCTSTASVQNPEDRENERIWWCCKSRWTMAISGFLFLITVIGGTVAIGYLFWFSDIFRRDANSSTQQFAPSMAPSRPNLRPANQISESCSRPRNNAETSTVEAEYAEEILGSSTISNANTGYCGDGYVSIKPNSGSGFGISSSIKTTGYYSISLRYSNADIATKFLTLDTNGRNQGTFDLVPTGDAASWSVDTINNVLLSKGENAIRLSMLDSEGTIGPSADWVTLVLQEPLSELDYFSGLVAQASGITTQTLLPTETLEWMTNDDPIDYSTLTDAETIERFALLHIYFSTAGDMWRNNRFWLSELHVCSWYGVTCSEDMLVTELALENNNMVGFFPSEISLLTNLVLISMDNNSLQGPIPKQIGSLTNLSEILLYSNFLSGVMPSELGSLQELRRLDLRTNMLNGNIPENLFSATSLEKIALGSNFLTGTLSTSVGRLQLLNDLDLQIGQLTGTIPSELGTLTLLTHLSLGYNRFTGQVPGELGLLQNLSLLDINSNLLTGFLPPELSLLTDTVIDYYGNKIIE